MDNWIVGLSSLLIGGLVVWHVADALRKGRFDSAWPGGGIRSVTRRDKPVTYWGSIIGILICGFVLVVPLLIIAVG